MLQADERRLIGDAGDAVVAVSDSNIVEFANAAALDLLGRDASLVGLPLTVIIPERLRPAHLAGFTRYVRSGVSRLQGGTVRVPALRMDGTEIDVDLTIRVFRRPDGSKVAVAALVLAATGHAPPGLKVLEDAFVSRLYQLV